MTSVSENQFDAPDRAVRFLDPALESRRRARKHHRNETAWLVTAGAVTGLIMVLVFIALGHYSNAIGFAPAALMQFGGD
ncbi:hypothetical protein [Pararhizobium mangrovi]|uniref:Uncharacterized protein n=1 Tax=Pararhizobium mangrovi TaxID=2590452 RepID=A0A506TWJ9_9HYPH|nr:hypothetical protein [Pararhizobium mangrovi]TPW25860.1 hypothetical protein FJU11_17355 [Pararhizobium mangrovi]